MAEKIYKPEPIDTSNVILPDRNTALETLKLIVKLGYSIQPSE